MLSAIVLKLNRSAFDLLRLELTFPLMAIHYLFDWLHTRRCCRECRYSNQSRMEDHHLLCLREYLAPRSASSCLLMKRCRQVGIPLTDSHVTMMRNNRTTYNHPGVWRSRLPPLCGSRGHTSSRK